MTIDESAARIFKAIEDMEEEYNIQITEVDLRHCVVDYKYNKEGESDTN